MPPKYSFADHKLNVQTLRRARAQEAAERRGARHAEQHAPNAAFLRELRDVVAEASTGLARAGTAAAQAAARRAYDTALAAYNSELARTTGAAVRQVGQEALRRTGAAALHVGRRVAEDVAYLPTFVHESLESSRAQREYAASQQWARERERRAAERAEIQAHLGPDIRPPRYEPQSDLVRAMREHAERPPAERPVAPVAAHPPLSETLGEVRGHLRHVLPAPRAVDVPPPAPAPAPAPPEDDAAMYQRLRREFLERQRRFDENPAINIPPNVPR
jgi:hypothetical protein